MKKIMIFLCTVMYGAVYTFYIDPSRAEYQNPLHKAIQQNDLSKVEQLLKEGSDINALSGFLQKHFPLQIAIEMKNEPMVDLLLKNGADVNLQIGVNWTPLFFAVEKNNISMVQKLLKAGAVVNVSDSGNRTPLSIATSNHNIPMMKILLKAGANPNIRVPYKDDREDPPLMFAIEHEISELVELLLAIKDIDVDMQNKYGFTALHYAASLNRKDWVEMLLKHGANPFIMGKDPLGPIKQAETPREMTDNVEITALLEDAEQHPERMHLVDSKAFMTDMSLKGLTLKKLYLDYYNGDHDALLDTVVDPNAFFTFKEQYFRPKFLNHLYAEFNARENAREAAKKIQT